MKIKKTAFSTVYGYAWTIMALLLTVAAVETNDIGVAAAGLASIAMVYVSALTGRADRHLIKYHGEDEYYRFGKDKKEAVE